jgi:hypothetical protein
LEGEKRYGEVQHNEKLQDQNTNDRESIVVGILHLLPIISLCQCVPLDASIEISIARLLV